MLSDKNVKFNQAGDGKKPLNEVVNITAYPRLLSLCKYVEVYICPKRMPQRTLIDLTENLLHQYFRKHRFEDMIRSEDSLNDKESFPEFVFEELSRREKQSGEAEFEKIKSYMNYDSKRKKNVIVAYDLLTIFLESFRNNQNEQPQKNEQEYS
ncbi:unnamed protein product [Sphagnum jensenii]